MSALPTVWAVYPSKNRKAAVKKLIAVNTAAVEIAAPIKVLAGPCRSESFAIRAGMISVIT
jgi:hypothetical protein